MPREGFTLRCTLPEPLVELPEVLPERAGAVAEDLADRLFTGLPDDVRRMVIGRYAAALRLRAAQGPAIVAIVQASTPDGPTASLLTLRLVASEHADVEVAAAAMLEGFRRAGPSGAQIELIWLPLGPGVARLRQRTLRGPGEGGTVDVPLATLELLVPLLGRRAMMVLDLICPTLHDLARHTALAGTVAASVTVD